MFIPEVSSQHILVGLILVGRLGAERTANKNTRLRERRRREEDEGSGSRREGWAEEEEEVGAGEER